MVCHVCHELASYDPVSHKVASIRSFHGLPLDNLSNLELRFIFQQSSLYTILHFTITYYIALSLQLSSHYSTLHHTAPHCTYDKSVERSPSPAIGDIYCGHKPVKILRCRCDQTGQIRLLAFRWHAQSAFPRK